MKMIFSEWLSTFKPSICDYSYYTDFEKVYQKVDNIKVELNILNSLIASKDIEKNFRNLVQNYSQILKRIPILLSVRSYEIYINDKVKNIF